MTRLLILLILAGAAWSATGFYIVQPDEIVLVRRCGRLLATPRLPGAHAGLPWGIDLRHRIKPREVKRVSIGSLQLAGEASGRSSTPCLSADRNLVNVSATVQYTIDEAANYLRQLGQADSLVGTAGQAALVRVLTRHPIDYLLTRGKTEVSTELRSEVQTTLDRYGLGISVRSVELRSLEPPAEVAPAFADVVAAQREREQSINHAHSYRSEILADAEAEAQRVLDSARAGADGLVRQAIGESRRFEQLLAEYEQAPTLTAQRLYWEAMSEILPRLQAKLLVDDGRPLDLSVFGTQPPAKPESAQP